MIANKVATKIQIFRKLSENIGKYRKISENLGFIFNCAAVWQYLMLFLPMRDVDSKVKHVIFRTCFGIFLLTVKWKMLQHDVAKVRMIDRL